MEIKRVLYFVLFCIGGIGICHGQSTWTLKSGEAIEGKALRVSSAGDVVIQTESGISNFPINQMSKESVKRLEEQFASIDLKQLADAVNVDTWKQQRETPRNRQVHTHNWEELSSDQKNAIYLMVGSVVLILIGYILLLVAAFKENPMWGIAILLFGISSLIFYILHFNKAKLALLLQVIGFVGLFGGIWWMSHAAV